MAVESRAQDAEASVMVDSEAIDATDLVVCVRDRTGRYVLINAGFEELTGLPRERIQGKRDAALNPQDIAERISLHDGQVFDTAAPSEVDEELLGREGRVPVRSCRFAICNDDGEPWAVCSVSGTREKFEHVRAERDRLGAIAEGTPKPHSAVTSERLQSLVSDLATARETAAGLTEALEAERGAREEQAEALAQAQEAAARADGEREAAAAELERERAALEQERAAHAELAARAEQAEAKRDKLAARLEERETGRAELVAGLERERAAAAKLSERIKSLESAKRAPEGGLLQNVRLHHERAERAKATARADEEAAARKQLAAQLDAQRAELDATCEQLAATRTQLAAQQAGLDGRRAEAAAATEALAQAHRDLERTRHELEAAREELAGATVQVPETTAVEVAEAPRAQARASSSLVAVQRRVTDLIADAASLDGAMKSGLAAFGELAGWDAAVGWLLARDGKWLRPASVWCSQAVAGSTFETQTWQAILDDGPTAIAAAWEAAETVWLEDAGAEEDRPRCRWARSAGLSTAAAVPVTVDGEPRGMIELYSRDRCERDDDVLAVLETIAAQLGGIERLLELADRPRWH